MSEPVQPSASAQQLLQTVLTQAETIRVQADTIARLQQQVAALTMDGEPEAGAGAAGFYLDGTPR